MFEKENIDGKSLGFVALFAVILIFVVVVGLQVLFFRMEKQEQAVLKGKRPGDLAAMLAEQNTQLNTYKWVDKTAGVAQVPIKRAMQLELEDLNARRP